MNSIFSLWYRVKDKLQTKTYNDEFLRWLRFANAGMLHSGNIFLMKYVVERLPSKDPIVEIGSFCGLSTNVINYFLQISKKENEIFCSDKWVFEGAQKGGFLGASDISHSSYSAYVKESFARNINLFSQNKPYPIELFSDEFFEKWSKKAQVSDIFHRNVKLGGKISFCYIDGNHEYEFAKRDFENVDKYLISGGFILFDDSSDSNPFGLTKLMKEIERNQDYKLVMKNPNCLFQKC
jgi:hypothetical protein